MRRAELLERWPTMTPRERDAVVATLKIAGLTHYAGKVWRGAGGWMGEIPYYSTSWADAGGLLDALLDYLREEHGFEAAVSIDTHDRFYPGMRWEVVFTPGPPEERQVALGTTAPEALSLAYCLAKAED